VIGEAQQIAARLAALALFPVPHGDWDSRADVHAEGNVLTITVTDRGGRSKREYRAVVQLIGSTSATGESNG
jgi:hypothetical protein